MAGQVQLRADRPTRRLSNSASESDLLRVEGAGAGLALAYHSAPEQLTQRPLQRLRPIPEPGLNGVADLVRLAFLDQCLDARGGDQDLEGGDPPPTDDGQQLLIYDAREACGQLDANLLLVGGGEAVEDPVDCLGGVVGVQRRQNQMPGFSDGQGGRDRLQVCLLYTSPSPPGADRRSRSGGGGRIRSGPRWSRCDMHASG